MKSVIGTSINNFPKEKGVYILSLQLIESKFITIGKLGSFNFDSGNYYYIGSAVGSGGIAGRIKHHFEITEKPHWHIDYLRYHSTLKSVYFKISSKEEEHLTASILSEIMISPIKYFGSSDCNCSSHLFYSKLNINLIRFISDFSRVNFK